MKLRGKDSRGKEEEDWGRVRERNHKRQKIRIHLYIDILFKVKLGGAVGNEFIKEVRSFII